jgi:flagellar motor switch protein FliN
MNDSVMSDVPEKKLIAAFTEAWGEAAPALLGDSSSLGLLSLREVKGEDLASALAVAVTWSAGFTSACAGALPGVVVYLFKGEDCEEIERRAQEQAAPPADGRARPGSRALVAAALAATGTRLGAGAAEFGTVEFLDLSAGEGELAAVVGDSVWFATCSLTLGAGRATQALVLYAPHGSVGANTTRAQASSAARQAAFSSAATRGSSTLPQSAATPPAVGNHTAARHPAPRNIDRLLDVEMEIVVRFGLTHLPLRELVRLGSGSMIELNRAVDEPVELLVNGRHLARGSVVVVDGYYGVRITEIGEAEERPI